MLVLSREQLYERVWAEPLRIVAQSLGVSEFRLKKICVRAEVPVPDRGYWAKHRAGQPANQTRLPPRGPAMPHEVEIGEQLRWRSSQREPQAILAEPPPTEPIFTEPIEVVRARIQARVGKVRFERDLAAGVLSG